MRRLALTLLALACLPTVASGQIALAPASEGHAEIRADVATLTVSGPITVTPPSVATVRSEPGRVVIEWAIGPGPVPPGPVPPGPVPPTPTPNPPQPVPPQPTPTPQVLGKLLVKVQVDYKDFASYPEGVWKLRTSPTVRKALADLDAVYLFDQVKPEHRIPRPGLFVFDATGKIVLEGPVPASEAELVARVKALRGKP